MVSQNFEKRLFDRFFHCARAQEPAHLAKQLLVDRHTCLPPCGRMDILYHEVVISQYEARDIPDIDIGGILFFDVGVFRAIRHLGPLDSTEEIDGPAIETLWLQEMRAHNDYRQLGYSFFCASVRGARHQTQSSL
jgi:hypothetical protein